MKPRKTTDTTRANAEKSQRSATGIPADRIRWRRYFLSRAASNPYLERPAYAD